MSPLMGGFSLVCAGVAPPEIVKEEGYLFAAYPRFHARSVALKRYLDPPSDASATNKGEIAEKAARST
jgi:hypothetical protein